MSTEQLSKHFSEDHHQLDSYFQEFQKNKSNDYQRAKEFFKKFKVGLQRHIAWEEEVLFPVFEEKTGLRGRGPTEVMRQEHRSIESALEHLHEKVRFEDPNSAAEETRLLNLLREHNVKEEMILYPAVDEMTSAEEQQKVLERIAALPEAAYKRCCCQVKLD